MKTRLPGARACPQGAGRGAPGVRARPKRGCTGRPGFEYSRYDAGNHAGHFLHESGRQLVRSVERSVEEGIVIEPLPYTNGPEAGLPERSLVAVGRVSQVRIAPETYEARARDELLRDRERTLVRENDEIPGPFPIVTHHIHVQRPNESPSLPQETFHVARGTEQGILFPAEKDQLEPGRSFGGAELPENPGEFHHYGRSAGVVIGARGDVAVRLPPAVVVRTYHQDAVFTHRPDGIGDNVHQGDRRLTSVVDLELLALDSPSIAAQLFGNHPHRLSGSLGCHPSRKPSAQEPRRGGDAVTGYGCQQPVHGTPVVRDPVARGAPADEKASQGYRKHQHGR